MTSEDGAKFELPPPDIKLLNDYLAQEQVSNQKTERIIKILYENKIASNLDAMGHSRQASEELSKSMIESGERICSFNANPEPNSNRKALAKKCNDTANQYKLDFFCNVLHIYSYTSEDKQRVDQMTSMFSKLNLVDSRNKLTSKTCLAYNEMKETIKMFLANANDSVEGIIIFNSHGCEQGLQFQHEPQPVDINKVCRDAYTLRQHLKDPVTGFEIPHRIRLVFAQCWSHVAEIGDCNINGFQIVALSSPLCPETTNTYVPVLVNGVEIGEYHHKELDAWTKNMEIKCRDYVSYLHVPHGVVLEGTTVETTQEETEQQGAATGGDSGQEMCAGAQGGP